MIDLTKGLVEYRLSDDELEKYRALKPPTKYGDISTLATRDLSRKTTLSTNTIHPNGLRSATR